MKRIFVFLLVLFVILDAQGQRKKVGLVLSGGGAKGVAHIGVLKVLEEAGIPIDYIAGTSMGSLVGALYAIGYDAHAMDSLVRRQDWMFLLSDKVYRYNLPFSEKEETEKYLVSVPIKNNREIKIPSGFISGQNVYNLFSDLTIGYHDSLDFKKLPIPFACVASNLVDGKEVIQDYGVLPLAMRASMAIPGAFAPVRQDSMVLVDGGISNNFPVDIAKAMGADIIIGVMCRPS
ncbi:MAG: patatin-like phospholipase family protein [Butyricimonas faecalis]